MNVQNALQLAMRNKNSLILHKESGCFHCLNNFETKLIKDYTDQGETALCPKCGTDAVVPGVVSKEHLSAIRNYWLN